MLIPDAHSGVLHSHVMSLCGVLTRCAICLNDVRAALANVYQSICLNVPAAHDDRGG